MFKPIGWAQRAEFANGFPLGFYILQTFYDLTQNRSITRNKLSIGFHAFCKCVFYFCGSLP